MKRTVAALGLIATMIGGSLSPAVSSVYAAEEEDSENITLTPAVSRPQPDAGQLHSAKLTVINNGTSDYTFVVYARPYSVKGERYDPDFTEVNEKTQAYQWIQFNRTEYRLEAGRRVDVPYTVKVPVGAAGGGHYAVLFAETQPEGSDNTSVMRRKRVGSLLYMTVKGETRQSGSLASWDAETWQIKSSVSSMVRVKNTGNVHFQTDVQVRYTDIFGRKRFEFNKQLLILPGTTRSVPVEWTDSPAFGIFKASGSVNYLDKSDDLAARYIILLPLTFILATLGAIMLLVILVVLNKRKGRRRVRLGR